MMYILIFIMHACGSVLENELGVYLKTYGYVMYVSYNAQEERHPVDAVTDFF